MAWMRVAMTSAERNVMGTEEAFQSGAACELHGY